MSNEDDFRANVFNFDRAAAQPAEEFGPSDLRDQVRSQYADVQPSATFTARMDALQASPRRPRGRGWAVLGTVAAVAATTGLVLALPRHEAVSPPAEAPTSSVLTSAESTPSVSDGVVTVVPPVSSAAEQPASSELPVVPPVSSSVEQPSSSVESGNQTTPNAMLTLTPQGLGELRLGMTIDEVRAVEPGFSPADASLSTCGVGSVGDAFLYFNPDGGLSLISTEGQTQVQTEDGLRVGDPASKIAELYAGRTQIKGSGTGSWIAVTLDEATGLEYWIWTDFSGDVQNGDDPFTSDATVTQVSLNRDQRCVN